jgi:hypothetical protein
MRKRLLVAAAFAAVGLAAAIPLGDLFGLGHIQALISGGAAGAFLGYVVSIFLDIFLTNHQEAPEIEN